MRSRRAFCLSGSAFEPVRGRTTFAFDDLDERSLKNIERPVRLHDVRPAGSAPAAAAARTEPAKPLPHSEPNSSLVVIQYISSDVSLRRKRFYEGYSVRNLHCRGGAARCGPERPCPIQLLKRPSSEFILGPLMAEDAGLTTFTQSLDGPARYGLSHKRAAIGMSGSI